MTPSIHPFLPILVLFLVALVTGVAILVVSGKILPAFLKPHHPRPQKLTPYECGAPLLQEGARRRYGIQFYLVAILFLLFDVEAAFLIPWAVQYKKNLWTFWPMLTFFGTLLVGYIYIWGRGALEWER